MAKKTLMDLWFRAQTAIDRREDFVFDVAAESGQIVDNVSHMRWFHGAVAEYLIDNVKTWEHLEVPKRWQPYT